MRLLARDKKPHWVTLDKAISIILELLKMVSSSSRGCVPLIFKIKICLPSSLLLRFVWAYYQLRNSTSNGRTISKYSSIKRRGLLLLSNREFCNQSSASRSHRNSILRNWIFCKTFFPSSNICPSIHFIHCCIMFCSYCSKRDLVSRVRVKTW